MKRCRIDPQVRTEEYRAWRETEEEAQTFYVEENPSDDSEMSPVLETVAD